jgi:hypothetical protein
MKIARKIILIFLNLLIAGETTFSHSSIITKTTSKTPFKIDLTPTIKPNFLNKLKQKIVFDLLQI